jgi:hypothetical protein
MVVQACNPSSGEAEEESHNLRWPQLHNVFQVSLGNLLPVSKKNPKKQTPSFLLGASGSRL